MTEQRAGDGGNPARTALWNGLMRVFLNRVGKDGFPRYRDRVSRMLKKALYPNEMEMFDDLQ